MPGRYVQLLVQEMTIKLEVGLFLSLMAVFKFQQPSDDRDFERSLQKFLKDVESTKQSLVSEARQSRLALQENLYDYIHLSPIKVRITAFLIRFWRYFVLNSFIFYFVEIISNITFRAQNIEEENLKITQHSRLCQWALLCVAK